jgi:hypothetical protein
MLKRAVHRFAVLVTSLSLVFAVPLPLPAQTDPNLAKGAHVRVLIPATAGQPERYVFGSLVRLEADTVVIVTWGPMPTAGVTTGDPRSPATSIIALDRGKRLEGIVDSHDHKGTGAALGALLGALVGEEIGRSSWQPCTRTGFLACFMYPSKGEQAAGGAILGGAGAALLGLAIGAGIRTETWGPLHTAGVRLAVTPHAVGISLAF